MQTPGNDSFVRAQLLVWWAIWFSLISGLCILYYFLARPVATDGTVVTTMFDFIGLVPLAASVVVRWFVLPKCTSVQVAFVAFIVGISLAEACGILAIFLGTAYRDEMFVLGVLGIAQFVPFYARRFSAARTA